MSARDRLLLVQEHDTTIDRLRARRAALEQRQVLARAESEVAAAQPELASARSRRDAIRRDVERLEGETGALSAKALEVEKAMYSGTVTSPRELQAMQAEVEQLARRRRSLEDRELELMEAADALEREVETTSARLEEARRTADSARRSLQEKEAVIDTEIAAAQAARRTAAADVPQELFAEYERRRARAASGVGAARLVGSTCQGCRLTIPASEIDRIRRAGPDGAFTYCDNCGAILVPA